jgi:fatty-acyl-CoA synthase
MAAVVMTKLLSEMMEDLAQFLASIASDATAIHHDGRRMTFAQLDDLSRRAAGGLKRLGVESGDRVGLWLPNTPVWLVLFFACARIGVIAVSVNTRFRSHEVQDIVGRSGCKVLVLWPGFKGIDFIEILGRVDAAALTSLRQLVVYEEDDQQETAVLAGTPSRSYADLIAGEPYAGVHATAGSRCVIFTTSGTTRAPKFVCHTQGAVVHHARDVAAAFGLAEKDSMILQALPLCGVFGFTQAMAALAARSPMIMMPVFDVEQAVGYMRERRVTHTCGGDDMLERMLVACPEPRPFPALRYYGYARFNPELEDIVERADGRGVVVRGLYGMSEVQALYAIQPLEASSEERKKGGGKLVSPLAAARVRDPESRRMLRPGEHGEIELKGPSLMLEYFNDAEATAAIFTDDGFLKTGDLGYMEPDGRFCYVTRMGDVLRLGGFLTGPQEIEAVLDRYPDVTGSQVVGINIDQQPVAVAFVIPRQGAEIVEADLQAFCRRQLAGYKVPRRIFPVEAFPTTLSANGTKIQRNKLREMALERVHDSHGDIGVGVAAPR